MAVPRTVAEKATWVRGALTLIAEELRAEGKDELAKKTLDPLDETDDETLAKLYDLMKKTA